MPIQFNPVSAGLIIEDGNLTITAFNVQHRGPDCLGFVFEEKGRRPFLPEKADALGVPPGPCRRDLVEGKAITLPDGKTISPEDVLGDYKPGTRLVVVGDVGEVDSLVDICRGADALVIESTYLDEEAEMAQQFSHMTAKRSAELAVKAGVRSLYLTHISRRYREKDVIEEAQSIFPQAVVARDFDIFPVKHPE